MKLFTFAILLIQANLLIAQSTCWTGELFWRINLDNGQYLEGLYIYNSSNSNNIWEIGAPQKLAFTTNSNSCVY